VRKLPIGSGQSPAAKHLVHLGLKSALVGVILVHIKNSKMCY